MHPSKTQQGYIRGVGREKVQIVVCDTLRIGDMTLYDIPFYVLDIHETGRKSMLDSLQAASFLAGMKVILGNAIMKSMGCLHFDFEEGTLTVSDIDMAMVPSNLAWQEKEMLLSVCHDCTPFQAFLDTGSPRSHLNYHFYARNKGWIKDISRRDTYTVSGIGGAEKVHSLHLPQVTLQVAEKDVILKDISVITDKRTRSSHFDGDMLLGMDFIRLFRWMTIDMTNMRLDGELK